VLVFRPHNVYGPDMGWEHVVPQFVLRMKELCEQPGDPVRFSIQGDGSQTRAFVYIEDFTDGLMLVIERGEHRGIYHIGTGEEVSMAALARMVGEYFHRGVEVIPGREAAGGTPRRCPDTRKLAALGYAPKWSLREGLRVTAGWYCGNASRAPGAGSERKDSRWQVLQR
jgi:nucleoside-diphosphate-sugar epimerase